MCKKVCWNFAGNIGMNACFEGDVLRLKNLSKEPMYKNLSECGSIARMMLVYNDHSNEEWFFPLIAFPYTFITSAQSS